MTKGKSRIISLFLAFIMIFTMLPMNVFADNSLHNGLSAPYVYRPTKTDTPYTGPYNQIKSMNGYKLSVWFADMVGQDEKGNPIYGWGDSEFTQQIGVTYYWRRTDLVLKSGEPIKLGFWSTGNIYSQTNLGEDWGDSFMSASMAAENGEELYYSATDYQLEHGSSRWASCQSYFNNLSIGLKAIVSCGFSLYDVAFNDKDFKDVYGFLEVRDFFARMLDMEHPERADLQKFHNLFYQNYVLDQGREMDAIDWDVTIWNDEQALLHALIDTVGDYYGIPIQGCYDFNDPATTKRIRDGIAKVPVSILATASDFQLPFPTAMNEKTDTGINNASSQYLKSYFLNPLILNEISYMTGWPERGRDNGGYWQVDEFIRGVFVEGGTNSGGTEHIGQYKIYIEPVMFRSDYRQAGFPATLGVMSWRDFMLAGKAMGERKGDNGAVYLSFIGNFSRAVPQIANAMMLDKIDTSLKDQNTGKAAGEGGFTIPFVDPKDTLNDTWGKTGVYTQIFNPINTLGVSIVTSPSTVGGSRPPDIIKTYVTVEGVNPDGSLNYKKAAPTVHEVGRPEKFYLDENQNLTIHPMINHVETVLDSEGVEIGDAILNDMFTTPYTLILNENSEWVNTDFITNIGITKGATNAFSESQNIENKVELYPTAEDIAGYRFGMVTGSDLFISNIEKFVATVVQIDPELTRQEINESINEAFVRTDKDIASANEKIYVLPIGNKNSKIYAAIKQVDSVKFENTFDVGIGKLNDDKDKVEKIDFTIDDTSYELLYSVTTPANTLVLRYILMPAPKQVNLIRFYEKAADGTLTEKFVQVEDPVPLLITGNEVTIQEPVSEIPEGATDPEVVKWVTNSEYPIIGITDSLPEKSENGLEGTTPNNIPNYPTEPLTHNLYVEWKVIEEEQVPLIGANQDVPEWRISKYLGAITDEYDGSTLSAGMSFTKQADVGCLPKNKATSLTPYGTYSYKLVNANGRLSNGSDTPANMQMNTIGSVGAANIDSNYAGVAPNTWFHSKTFVYGGDSDYIDHGDNRADIDLDATLNMIKSDDSGALIAANWLKDNVNGLDEYTIKNGNKPKGYSGETEYTKIADLRLGIYNSNTYTHIYGRLKSGHRWSGSGENKHWIGCRCKTGTETISPSSANVTYTTANYSLDVVFDRYKQKDTTAYTLSLSNNDKYNITNGLTTIKYQLADSIKIYPEVGMLFDDDANKESIRWMIGDKVREIKPVVYQTLEHKVYVKPTSTGTSVANDSRGITKANSIGEAGKQIIYKGAGVNTNFRLYQSKDSNKVALLTIKTYALDINNNGLMNGLKAAWGNSAYNSYAMHKSLLSNFQAGENSKATVTEKLLVDGNPYSGIADFEGAAKTSKSNPYKLVKYQTSSNIVVADGSDGAAVVFEHELIIRGGYLIGVRMDKHNGSKELLTISDLRTKAEADLLSDYASFYNALVGMSLYDTDNNKNKTILQTLEHKPNNAKILDEGEYATQLASARRTVDGISTPSYAAISNGDAWYSEDTTVLVVKEYISNFEVPSISISDKLPMTVTVPQNKLDTPANKAQFFSELGKGYLYLNYTLNLQLPTESGITQNNVVKAYFEYTSTPNDVGDVKGFKSGVGSTLGSEAPHFGDQVTNYLVPNVSITDTTRMN